MLPENVQPGADEIELGVPEKATSFLAGAVAGVWGAVLIGSTITLLAPALASVPQIGNGVRVLTGVRVAEDRSVGAFFNRAILGTCLGCSLVLAGAALNWMVEELDALGDKPSIPEPQNEALQNSTSPDSVPQPVTEVEKP